MHFHLCRTIKQKATFTLNILMPCKDWNFHQDMLLYLMFLICCFGLCFAYRLEVRPLWMHPTAFTGLQWHPRTRIYAGKFALPPAWSLSVLLHYGRVLKESKRSKKRQKCQNINGPTLPSILVLAFCFLNLSLGSSHLSVCNLSPFVL